MNYDTAYEAPAGETLAVGLGWFSIALGVAELAAPHSVARFIGVAPTEKTIATLRSFGAREVGTGMAILAQPDRATWLWSRAAGDALDLATLAGAPTTHRGRATLAAAAVIGVAALDVLCARQLSDANGNGLSDRRPLAGWLSAGDRRVSVSEAITVNQPLELVEAQWNRAEELPESLRSLGRSHAGTDERAIVEFRNAPGNRGTEVRVELEYSPRGGAIGAALAKVFGADPTGQLRHDLHRFKQLVETGEVVLSDGPSLWRPAQPAEQVQDIRHAAGLGV
jgi:uncharacterized membrane protein